MQDTGDSPYIEVHSLDCGAVSGQVGLDFADVAGAADPEVEAVGVTARDRSFDLTSEPELAQEVARLVEITPSRRCDDCLLRG